MAFIPVPLVYHAQIFGMCDGQQIVNNLYFQREGVGDLLEAETLAANLVEWFTGDVLPNLADTYLFDRVVVTDIATQFGVQATAGGGSTPGGVVSEQAPNNVAACISFRTGIRGRSYRGRNYLAGVPNADIDTNNLQPSFMTNIRNAYNVFTLNGVVSPLVWVVVSRYGNGLPRVAGVRTPVANAIFTDSVVDSQRRRLPGRGS